MAEAAWADYKAVKAKVGIRDVLSRYGLLDKLRPQGKRLVGGCPIHHGTNDRQFSVTPDKHAFKCFSGECEAAGNQVDLVAYLEGFYAGGKSEEGFRKAALKLQEWFGIVPDRPARGSATRKADDAKTTEGSAAAQDEHHAADGHPPAAGPEKTEVAAENKPLTFYLNLDATHAYLGERGLTPATVTTFGLGLCGRGSMKGRVCAPIHNEGGELVAYAGRWVGKDEDLPQGEGKWKLPAGFHKSLVVFNLHRVPADAKRVIVVEGFWSVFWISQCGLPNVVALMGSTMSERQRELLVERFKGVQLFLDGDDAGRTAAGKIAGDLVRRLWVKVVECPDGLQPDRLPAHELKRLLA